MLKSLVLLVAISFSTFAFSSVESDFFQNPQFTSPKINPIGTLLLAQKLNGNHFQVLLKDVSSFEEKTIFTQNNSNGSYISGVYWLGDHNFAISTYHNLRGGKVFMFTIDNDKNVERLGYVEDTYMFNPQLSEPDKFIAYRFKHGKPHLFSVDIKNDNFLGQFQSKKRISRGPLSKGQWLLDTNGNANVNYKIDEDETQVYVKRSTSKNWQKVWDQSNDIDFNPVLFDQEKNELYVISQKQTGYAALYRFNTETKTFSGTEYKVPGRDITAVIINPYEQALIGYSYRQGGIEKHVYNTKLAQLVGEMHDKNTIPEGYVINFSDNYEQIIYIDSSIDKPISYYLYNKKTNKSRLFGEERPWLNEYKLGTSRVISSISSDNETVESYLTVPQSDEPNKKHPLLVIPHGGPLGVSDSRHFSLDVHYFVQKGYAVLTPNYRGSSGFGEKFLNQGKQQWGRLIEDDIESAVNKVIEQGYVNENQICIFGISYGGYSALISAIRRPDLYKCAASYAGVTDIPLLFTGGSADVNKKRKTVLTDILGDPDKSWDTLVEFSPIYRAKELEVPVLLAQGGRDRIVDSEHFFRMKYVLQKHEKSFEEFYVENEVHGFRYIRSQTTLYRKIHKFISRSLSLEMNN